MKKSNVFMLCAFAAALGTVAAFALGFKLPQVEISDYPDSGSVSMVNEYIRVEPETRIEIDNATGTVRIEPVEGDTVHVAGTLGENVLPLVIEDEDGFVKIRTVRGTHWSTKINTGTKNDARLVVKVPAGHPLQVHTVSADQDINGYTGPRMKCESVSGDIRCGGVTEKAVIKTVSGDIVRSGKAGEIEISTVSGDMKVYNETEGDYRIAATSGDLVLHGGLREKGVLDVESVSGDIALWLPEEVAARFTLASMSGNITNAIPCTEEYRQDKPANKRFKGVSGNGSGEVTVKTTSGDIAVKRLVRKKNGV